jgi:hypothetical protein
LGTENRFLHGGWFDGRSTVNGRRGPENGDTQMKETIKTKNPGIILLNNMAANLNCHIFMVSHLELGRAPIDSIPPSRALTAFSVPEIWESWQFC